MRIEKTGALATGSLLLILGATMALVIGKRDITVICAGLLMVFGGIYILSLVNPATKQFMGTGWPERLCRLSAVIVGLLMVASGLVSSISVIREMPIIQDSSWFSLLFIGLLSFCWGLYILMAAANGVQS